MIYFCSILFFQNLLQFGEKEVFKAWKERNDVQYQMELILANLEEGIISKANDKIGFCNMKGTQIINAIGQNVIEGFELSAI